jgi:hypothetical protein
MKWLLLGLFVFACGSPEQQAQREQAGQKLRAHGAVVARVGEHEIGVEDVATTAREAGFTPEEALERLEAEALLGDLAETKGYASSSLSRRELKKAAARALLEVEVEAQVHPGTITLEAAQARFEQARATLRRPETRELVRLVWLRPRGSDGNAEREAARRALARLKLVPPQARRGELGAVQSEAVQEGFQVKLSAIHFTGGRKGDPFADTAKSMTTPGFAPDVVELPHGVAVLLLEAIRPPTEAVFADHEATIRETLLIEALRARTDVTYHEDAIGRLLADDALGSPE